MLRITFSINSFNAHLALYYAVGTVGLLWIQIDFQTIVDKSQTSVYQLQMPNMSDMYCDISYDDCCCAIISTENCLSSTQIKITRILPLALFVFQLCLLRELFSLDGSYKRVFIGLLWIASMITFSMILVIVYQKPCYYYILTTILCVTGLQLFLVFAYTLMFYH